MILQKQQKCIKLWYLTALSLCIDSYLIALKGERLSGLTSTNFDLLESTEKLQRIKQN